MTIVVSFLVISKFYRRNNVFCHQQRMNDASNTSGKGDGKTEKAISFVLVRVEEFRSQHINRLYTFLNEYLSG